MTALLERDDAESELHHALAGARAGVGGLVLIAGEAGMGKTSLTRAFLSHVAGNPTVLQGACDPVSTPRPFGPIVDAVGGLDPELATGLAGGRTRADVFASALDLITADPRGTVVVLEDMHWADEATLDLFTYLVRRLDDRPAIVIATFRSDEVDTRHPFRLRLGDVHDHIVGRIDLRPLSITAIETLLDEAAVDLDPTHLHHQTHGNAFYVTEIIDAGSTDTVPTSVSDAVLARASRLPEAARAVLDAASIVPGVIEPWLLDAIVDRDDADDGLDVCLELGLLRRRPSGGLEFRHELARLAIEHALAPAARRRWHRRCFDALAALLPTADQARLASHAAAAGFADGVLEHAGVAGRAALDRRDGAAVDLLRALAVHEHRLSLVERGDLWRDLGRSLVLISDHHASIAAFDRADALYEQVGDPTARSLVCALRSDPLWGLARQPEAIEAMRLADRLLGDDPPPSRAAAEVAETWCTLHMLAREPELAEAAGQRAIEIATAIGDAEALARTMIAGGISRCMAGDDDGLDTLRAGMELGVRNRLEHIVSYGLGQIGSGYGELRQYDIAIPALREDMEYCDAREYAGSGLYARAWLARCELETGEWEAAGRRAERLLRDTRCVGNLRLVVVCTLGWLRTRRGDPGAQDVLEEALELGRASQHIQRLWPAASARAEHAWTNGRLDDEVPVLEEALELARSVAYLPAIEEFQHWLHLADGEPRPLDPNARTPFALSAAGCWQDAAEAWDRRGCPFEAAFARVVPPGQPGARRAFEVLDRLGATATRRRINEIVRERGQRVPRGANRATAENPAGLTDRELDVLALLPTGATNAAIADELGISAKTVGHHVSNILRKLGVSTRSEAAVAAADLGVGPLAAAVDSSGDP